MYLTKLIKDINVGAILPTPKNIVNKMFKNVDFKSAQKIVEFGPGGGVITKHILQNINDNATLYVFERNSEFIKELNNINDDRLVIINNDAHLFKEILIDKYNITKVDYIFSTIPFSFFDEQKRLEILKNSHNILVDGGRFITYQYSKMIYKYLKTIFKQTRIEFTIKNIFPSFIMEGVK
jgi:phospholipid N-methyltransferase